MRSRQLATGRYKRAKPSVQEQFGAHQFLHSGQVRPLNAVYTLPGLTEAPTSPDESLACGPASASDFSNNNKTQRLTGFPHYWHN